MRSTLHIVSAADYLLPLAGRRPDARGHPPAGPRTAAEPRAPGRAARAGRGVHRRAARTRRAARPPRGVRRPGARRGPLVGAPQRRLRPRAVGRAVVVRSAAATGARAGLARRRRLADGRPTRSSTWSVATSARSGRRRRPTWRSGRAWRSGGCGRGSRPSRPPATCAASATSVAASCSTSMARPCPSRTRPAPPRLLPMWDSTILAFADRTRLISDEDRRVVIARNGDTLPTFTVDGVVAGLWWAEATAAAGRGSSSSPSGRRCGARTRGRSSGKGSGWRPSSSRSNRASTPAISAGARADQGRAGSRARRQSDRGPSAEARSPSFADCNPAARWVPGWSRPNATPAV